MHDFDWAAVQDRYDATLLANVASFIDSLASAEQLYDYVSNLDASNGNTGQPVFYTGLDFGIQSDGLANAGFQMLDQSQAQAFLDISRNIIYDRLRNTGVRPIQYRWSILPVWHGRYKSHCSGIS